MFITLIGFFRSQSLKEKENTTIKEGNTADL